MAHRVRVRPPTRTLRHPRRGEKRHRGTPLERAQANRTRALPRPAACEGGDLVNLPIVVPACCVPSKTNAEILLQSNADSAERHRASTGSTSGMRKLDGGPFLMGTETDKGFPQDGEGPVRQVTLDPFYIDITPVTNAQFAEFVRVTRYQT